MPLRKVTQDITEVATVNASVLGVTTFADFETILKIILIIVIVVIIELSGHGILSSFFRLMG